MCARPPLATPLGCCRQDSWVVVPLHSILKHQQQKDTPAANGSSSSSTDDKPSKGSSNSGGGKAASSSSGRSGSGGGRAGKGRGVQPVVVPDGCLEGTRLTLVNVSNQPDAVEFSIRCVCTIIRARKRALPPSLEAD